MLAVAELLLVHVCSYEVVLKNGDTKGQLMSLQQTLRQEIHAKIGAQTAEESAKRKVCSLNLSSAALQRFTADALPCVLFDTSVPLAHVLIHSRNHCMSSFSMFWLQVVLCTCLTVLADQDMVSSKH